MLIVMVDKESIVRKGYDEIAEEYSADRTKFDHSKELKEFSARSALVYDWNTASGHNLQKKTLFLARA